MRFALKTSTSLAHIGLSGALAGFYASVWPYDSFERWAAIGVTAIVLGVLGGASAAAI